MNQIIKHRVSRLGGRKARVEYLVSWAGYGPEENRWLGVTDLSQCADVVKQYWESVGEQPPEGGLPE